MEADIKNLNLKTETMVLFQYNIISVLTLCFYRYTKYIQTPQNGRQAVNMSFAVSHIVNMLLKSEKQSSEQQLVVG